MVVFMLEHVPASLRGELSRWLIEPRAGVFVGNISAMVREKLWEHILKKEPESGLMLLHSAKNEQGCVLRTSGDTTRQVIDMEGLILIRRIEKPRSTRTAASPD